MQFFRIADARFAQDRGDGARLHGGRWNSAGRPVIYACDTYSGAMLEKLVHTSGRMPTQQVCVTFEAPDALPVGAIEARAIPGWELPDMIASRAAGDAWLDSGTTSVLLVPSIVFGVERNVLINPAHADFRRISVASVEPVRWDERLFVAR